ncbi:MAG: hypothetical protein CVT65_11615 [Actinobacteria bacterium HGW-Actinobacteria-5]|nr:MAG: hypothetical protein CVT65_11615 [Actinobacteria bacterium HGW-Actinobacteria-5]
MVDAEDLGAGACSLGGQRKTKVDKAHQTPPQITTIASAPTTQLVGPIIPNPIIATSWASRQLLPA